MDLILATSNGHKIREMRALLKSLKQFDVYSILDFPDYIPPEETGKTFEENAVIKASHAAKAFNKWSLADDSGLIIPALNGAPGIFSRRYAGVDATDKDNRKKLLKEMENLEGIRRSAYFESVIALASPESLKKCCRGTCEGEIATQERGSKGFGYDSLFLKHDYNQTFGELEETIKNQISHRSKAFHKMLIFLESIEDPLYSGGARS